MTVTARFIVANPYAHVALSSEPYQTLCGWHFTAEGKADPHAFNYERARALEPFIETDDPDAVTCPECCAIIDALKPFATAPTDLDFDPSDFEPDPDFPGPDDERG